MEAACRIWGEHVRVKAVNEVKRGRPGDQSWLPSHALSRSLTLSLSLSLSLLWHSREIYVQHDVTLHYNSTLHLSAPRSVPFVSPQSWILLLYYYNIIIINIIIIITWQFNPVRRLISALFWYRVYELDGIWNWINLISNLHHTFIKARCVQLSAIATIVLTFPITLFHYGEIRNPITKDGNGIVISGIMFSYSSHELHSILLYAGSTNAKRSWLGLFKIRLYSYITYIRTQSISRVLS